MTIIVSLLQYRILLLYIVYLLLLYIVYIYLIILYYNIYTFTQTYIFITEMGARE